MKFAEFSKDLPYKLRTINDLVRHIRNRVDKLPNYSLFLGAGCSKTSGIRTAGELIAEWKREIVEQDFKNDIDPKNYTDESATEFLKSKSLNWYNPANEYSSLFEKRFDLERQRRMFIEQEVRNTLPSIGYSYLIRLIAENYFNTIFTTNFDDLANEAFNLFSDVRPIVCAHDSAISSITVTSKRPKIIKLHGDYLFDDLKSTVRETESLEQNMRKKFIEFSKEYGLLFVGYSGNDRSIIDILFSLLKNEEYLKHGIYWCFRENDEVSDELRKLLWKDRVYFIQIDGFDEFFATLHKELLPDQLPIEITFFSEKQNKIVDNYLNASYIKTSKLEKLRQDIINIDKQRKNKLLKDLLYSSDSPKSAEPHDFNNDGTKRIQNKNISFDQKLTLFSISDLLSRRKFSEAKHQIEKLLNPAFIKDDYQMELHQQAIRIYLSMGENDKALEIIEKLLSVEKSKSYLYLNYINITDKYEEKIKYLKMWEEYDKYDSRIYFNSAKIKWQKYSNEFESEKPKIDEVLSNLEKSLELNPSLNNQAVELKLNILLKEAEKNPDYYSRIEEFIQHYKSQNPHSSKFFRAETRIKENRGIKTEDIISDLLKTYNESIKKEELRYILSLFILEKTIDYGLDDKFIHFASEVEKNHEIDEDYIDLKTKFYAERLGEIETALDFANQSIELRWSFTTIKVILEFNLFLNRVKEAKQLIDEFVEFGKDDLEIMFNNHIGNYEKSMEIIDKRLIKDPHDRDTIIEKSFVLLCSEKYKEVNEFCRKYLDKYGWFDPILVVNYELSEKKLSGKVNKERLNRFLSNDKGKFDLNASIYSLLDDQKKSIEYIKKWIDSDKTMKYSLNKWPVFKGLKNNQEFIKLLKD